MCILTNPGLPSSLCEILGQQLSPLNLSFFTYKNVSMKADLSRQLTQAALSTKCLLLSLICEHINGNWVPTPSISLPENRGWSVYGRCTVDSGQYEPKRERPPTLQGPRSAARRSR